MHPGQPILMQEFRKQLLGLPISPLTHTQLTEKTWQVKKWVIYTSKRLSIYETFFNISEWKC